MYNYLSISCIWCTSHFPCPVCTHFCVMHVRFLLLFSHWCLELSVYYMLRQNILYFHKYTFYSCIQCFAYPLDRCSLSIIKKNVNKSNLLGKFWYPMFGLSVTRNSVIAWSLNEKKLIDVCCMCVRVNRNGCRTSSFRREDVWY